MPFGKFRLGMMTALIALIPWACTATSTESTKPTSLVAATPSQTATSTSNFEMLTGDWTGVTQGLSSGSASGRRIDLRFGQVASNTVNGSFTGHRLEHVSATYAPLEKKFDFVAKIDGGKIQWGHEGTDFDFTFKGGKLIGIIYHLKWKWQVVMGKK